MIIDWEYSQNWDDHRDHDPIEGGAAPRSTRTNATLQRSGRRGRRARVDASSLEALGQAAHCRRRFGLWIVLAMLGSVAGGWAQEKITYQDQVLPLIEANCAKCHNPDKRKGDLDLTSYNGVIKGGGSGAVVVAGNVDSSKLWKAITHAEDPTMPPNKKLPDKEIDVFRRWIAGGCLETSGSRALAAAKPTFDFASTGTATRRPDGPPPMPGPLPLDPVLHTERGNPIAGLASSPWAPLLAVTGQKQVLLFHADSLELLGVLPFAEGQPCDLKFSRNGKLLIAGGGHAAQSGRVIVWNIDSGERVLTLGKEYDTVLAADLSADQSRVALGGPDRLVKIYSTKTGELERKIKKHTDWVTALAFSPSGELLVTGDRNGGLSVWDAENGQELFTLAGHKAAVTAVSWRDDAKLIASASEDGSIKLWETQDGKQAKTWSAHAGGALSVQFGHDGRLVSCGRDNGVVLWSADGGKVRSYDVTGELPLHVALSHDGTRVFGADFAGRIAVWDATNGVKIGELDANPAPLAEQIAAAERRLAELASAGTAAVKPAGDAPEAELARSEKQLEQARAALELAGSKKTKLEARVVTLKEQAAKSPPSEGITNELASARSERFRARAAVTNLMAKMETDTRAVVAAKTRLERARKENDPAIALARAEETVARLRRAQIFGRRFEAREHLARRKLEHEQLLAAAEEKSVTADKIAHDRDSAADSSTRSKLKTAWKAAAEEAKSAAAAVKKSAADLSEEEKRFQKLSAESNRAPATATLQSRL